MILTLCHGSSQIVSAPAFGLGKKHNDFGQGFYCTESNELAKEWAVSSLRDGYSNRYTLDTECMRILNLNSCEYTILNWIAVLVEHRLFSIHNPGASRARKYLIDRFGVNVNAYDLVIGYRADDSYFDYVEAFLNNTITVEQLSLAMRLGKLGEQIVLKSKYATNMAYMFANCSSLKSMKLTHFRTNSIIDMSHMFFNCSSLEYLDISRFTYNLNNDTNTIS